MSTSNFVTYVILMPTNTVSRATLTAELQASVTRNGGVITGTSMDDEMTLNELLEARLDDIDVQEARQEAAGLAAEQLSQA
ncbi:MULTISPECIES: hypothetical protein [Pseudomonas syringae group]|uniref:Uncharacterized protein n=3 Tax=Pseudomonas syringae group TaxID=136849 RepID=A0AAW4DY66_PSESX|nr:MULTISPECIES: hypothetical protein [Pseudomonas syringae group]AVI83941.1 hypothetical protein XJ28_09560 [Pseudomonas syringae pv. tomato]EEB59017.1 hypothetical protein PSPTOT1_1075 [Pseudomonas syringae pv. tomato T1]KGK94060.1 hypothetical protein NB04_17640 [Pseudomonas syringae pv. tomato]KUR43864.1 hypothetical protein PST407_04631 [Pseudomonas syringae pv. tomato]KUR48125.1 hypothetical protein PSTA9_01273 [Pseudomonas syringae pv. tomato]